MEIRAFIVEDEPAARSRLHRMLATQPDVRIVGEAGDGGVAVTRIREERPDLVFLDIELPTMNGLEVLARIGDEGVRSVVFTTAYDKYALAAFDAAAVDYLLKPFDAARFGRTMARVRERLTAHRAQGEPAPIEALMRQLQQGQDDVRRLMSTREARDGRLVVRHGDRMPVVRHADIEYVEADGNYVKLVTPTGTHRLRGTIQGMLQTLRAQPFARIHRGTVVNLEKVREVQPWYSGDFVLVMQSGAKLRVSRTYNDALAWFGLRAADLEATTGERNAT